MHPRTFAPLLLAVATIATAQSNREPEPPVPVMTAPAPRVERPAPLGQTPTAAPAATPPTTFPAGGQRLYSPGLTIVPPDHAAQIVEEFRAAYDRLERPRIVIAVNRSLVEERDGLRLTGRKEHVETQRDERSSTHAAPPGGSAPQTQVNVAVGGDAGQGDERAAYGPGEMRGERERTTADNTYERVDVPAPSLADRQTVRDVERLFARPLRIAGAHVADPRVVADLIADRPLDEFLAAGGNEGARKDREALKQVADAVIEVLISTRSLTIPGYSGDETRTVPDIQATLIRLSDGAILGQASATDVLGRDRDAGPIVRQFEVRDIAEATALALMDDISRTALPGS